MSTRAEQVAAALELADRWNRTHNNSKAGLLIGELARLIRESQPEPPAPAVGEDEGLEINGWQYESGAYAETTDYPSPAVLNIIKAGDALRDRLRAALADVAEWKDNAAEWELENIQSQADLAQAQEANAVLKETVISMGRATNKAEAALAAAVAEETTLCIKATCLNCAFDRPFDPQPCGFPVNHVTPDGLVRCEALGIRARAGRNDV